MKPRFLFPSAFRYLGYLLAVPGFILGYLFLYQSYIIDGFGFALKDHIICPATETFTDELALTLVIVGLLFVAFSKLKREDELTGKIRLNALYWAILTNYCLYALIYLYNLLLLPYATPRRTIIDASLNCHHYDVYNLFVPLLIFIGRFYYLLYSNKNEFDIKEVHFLPYKPYNYLGRCISALSLLLIIVCTVYKIDADHVGSAILLIPLALLLWIYSKEKTEDEYINSLRLEAMQVAVYVNYGILLISNFLVYGFDFQLVQLINFVTIPLIFICWFQYKLYRTKNRLITKAILT